MLLVLILLLLIGSLILNLTELDGMSEDCNSDVGEVEEPGIIH